MNILHELEAWAFIRIITLISQRWGWAFIRGYKLKQPVDQIYL